MRCVRLFKGDEGQSKFEEGTLAMQSGKNESFASDKMQAVQTFFEETEVIAQPTWHTAPNRQFVVTLGGTLEFQTAEGQHLRIRRGDVLLAEDTTGSGQGWRIVGDEPWRRVYIVLDKNTAVPFSPN